MFPDNLWTATSFVFIHPERVCPFSSRLVHLFAEVTVDKIAFVFLYIYKTILNFNIYHLS